MLKKVLAFLGLFLVCSEVLAAVFSVAPTDRSVQYLGTIFGGSVGAVSLGGTVNPTLSKMFQGFNTIIVTMGGIVLGYIGVISTINTAREGEAMGKKLNIWVPMRGILGLLLMIPTPGTGYSVVQMTVMWVVLNGVGAANSVWNIAINQMAQGITAVGTVSIPLKASNINGALVDQILQSSTCAAYINNLNLKQAPFQNGANVTVFSGDPSAAPQLSTNPIQQTRMVYVGLKNAPGYENICGSYLITESIPYCNNEAGHANSCTSNDVPYDVSVLSQRLDLKTQAFTSMMSAAQDAAKLFAATPYTSPSAGYVSAIRAAYINQISLLAGMPGAKPANLSDKLQTMQSIGWAHAGSFYKDVVGSSSAQNGDSDLSATNPQLPGSQSPAPTYVNPLPASGAGAGGTTCPTNWPATLCTAINAAPGGPAALNTALTNAHNYYNTDQNTPPPSINGILNAPNNVTGNSTMDAILNPIVHGMSDPVYQFIIDLSQGNDDPLVSIGTYGGGMMIAAEVCIFVILGLLTVLTFATNWNDCIAAFGATGTQISSQLFFLVTGLCVLLWTAGATLGLYTPMIPYLMFTTAVFGWFIAVIEAVVAAPVLALSLVHPSGEELGKAGAGLGILANLFLRPTLMIFGFILGANLVRAALQLVNYGFLTAVKSSTHGSAFSFIPLMMMYAMLVIGLINKSFSLIYELPNQISRWLGGPAERHEGEKLVGEAKGGFDTGAKTVQETGGKMQDSAQKKVGENMKKYNKDKGKGP